MKILHVGFGFKPWRSGGLIQYAEDLMDWQRGDGHTVGYFFAGRHYPLMKKPWLRCWERRAISMFEVINPPVLHDGDRGTLDPIRDLVETVSEGLFCKALHSFRPDVIHIHELAGLPSSLIQIMQTLSDAAVVMTLQDYYLLCPTLKLYDSSHRDCLRTAVGEECVSCCRNATGAERRLVKLTVNYEIERLKDRIPGRLKYLLKAMRSKIRARPGTAAVAPYKLSAEQPPSIVPNAAPAQSYQRRRDTNLLRLGEVDLLIAQSRRVGQLYGQLGAVAGNLRTLNLTQAHLEDIGPRCFESPIKRLRFVTLNGCYSRPKGAYILLDALEKLSALGLSDKFELHAWGGISQDLAASFKSHSNFYHWGWYKTNQLDKILDGGHVGVIPSVWEEAFGFVGLEYLAKGLPIIGNAKGGITDYTIEGFTGWLNRSSDGIGLASIMAHLIAFPDEVIAFNRRIVAHRSTLIQTMSNHGRDIESFYREAIESRKTLRTACAQA